jgi:hypothetical protein
MRLDLFGGEHPDIMHEEGGRSPLACADKNPAPLDLVGTAAPPQRMGVTTAQPVSLRRAVPETSMPQITLEQFVTEQKDGAPLVRIVTGGDGRPCGASAVARLEHPVSRVWAVIADVERYAGRIPMIHRVRRDGDRVTVDLKFKLALFSVGFQFTADTTHEVERWMELRWVAGEPRGIRLRFELLPLDEGRACLLRGEGEFDIHSLGWLAKTFLKHHPEIQFGVFPGVALVLIDSMRRAAGETAS